MTTEKLLKRIEELENENKKLKTRIQDECGLSVDWD